MKPDDDIRQEVRRWPGATVNFDRTGRHPRAVLHFNGRERFVTIPGTPGDTAHGPKNNVAIVRRTLKTLGAIRVAIPFGRGRKRWRNPGAQQRVVVAGEPAPVMPDPWEPLSQLEQRLQNLEPLPADLEPEAPCECLACLSDMAGIYPCLIEENDYDRR